MNSLSSHNVVEQLANQLAERRRTSSGRRAAYLALAEAILGDQPEQLSNSSAFARRRASTSQAAAAAA